MHDERLNHERQLSKHMHIHEITKPATPEQARIRAMQAQVRQAQQRVKAERLRQQQARLTQQRGQLNQLQ
jgi:hypothetical protein